MKGESHAQIEAYNLERTLSRKPRRNLYKLVTKEVRAIRILRKRRGISQYKASEVCGFKECTFGLIEAGGAAMYTNVKWAIWFLFLSIFAFQATSASVIVYGPKTFKSGLVSTKEYNINFSGPTGLPAGKSLNGFISIQNGDGSNIEIESCSGSLLQKILCLARNLVKEAKILVDRPSDIELVLNGVTLLASGEVPKTQGQLQKAIKIQSNNVLKIRLKGLPTSSITLSVKSETQLPNVLPIARFTFNPNTGVAPQLISFSGLTSSDADGSIANYSWNFGDGKTGSGSLIDHLYTAAGSFSVNLTVTDDRGGSHTTTQAIIIVADNVAPLITINNQDNIRTNESLFKLSVVVSDTSSVTTEVFQNGNRIHSSSLKFFEYAATLIEGNNTFEVRSVDASGNNAAPAKLLNIFLDSVQPLLSATYPLQNQKLYTNQLPFNFPVQISSNEILSGGSVNGSALQLSADKLILFGNVSVANQGIFNVRYEGIDAVGNKGELLISPEIVVDTVAPSITIGGIENGIVGRVSLSLPIQISDSSPTQTKIIVNGVDQFATGATQFDANVVLNQEGSNVIQIVSKDAAGNASTASRNLTRDTTPPILSNLAPGAGSILHTLVFNVGGISNEVLSEVSVNGLSLTLSADKKQFSGNYITQNLSPLTLVWIAKDLVGNEVQTNIQVEVNLALLIQQLISIVPDPDGKHLNIVGAAGAGRPGIEVSAKADLLGFNSDSGTVNQDGSFRLQLSAFTSATLKAYDSSTNEQMTLSLNYQHGTRLSGTVKDTEGNPLPGATVRISTSAAVALTDGAGVFNIESPVTGDQTLTIDGATIPQAVTGSNRKFSQTTIQINIGLGQENILSRPIFLAPLIVDGSETQIVQNQSAVVESPRAEGVSLSIPANATIFPDGNPTGVINISSIDSNKATVPVLESAVPTKVVALEPSGLKFSQRIPVTLPNDNDLPPNVEMIILSMDGTKGTWEVDGMAKVSSDGQKIESKPGEGISHFSLIYAIPARPEILAVENPKQSGVDISEGSLTTQIQLPSWQSLGQKIAPSLVYKSNWANPTAYVSNYFDIPKQELSIKRENSTSTSRIQTVTGRYCETFLGATVRCYNIYDEYLINAELKENLAESSWYQPESVKSQFFVSNLTSGELKFIDSSSTSGSGDAQSQTIPGLVFESGLATGITSYVGIPNRAMISYAVPLRNPATNEYLSSGIYPTLTRFEIKLKNLVIRTYSRVKSSSISGKGVNESNVEITNEESKTSQVLDQIFPRDLNSSILVQNKVLSPAGRGWHLGLSQNILNPTGNRVMVEEASGEVSTYAVSNSISTVYNAAESGVQLDQNVDFSRWPIILASQKDGMNSNSLVEINLASQNPSVVSVGSVQHLSGQIGNQGTYACNGSSAGQFSTKTHAYAYQLDLAGILRSSTGEIFALNKREHSMFKLSQGAYVKLLGRERILGDSFPDNFDTSNYFNGSDVSINQQCNSLFGGNCDSGVISETLPCSVVQFSPPVCPPGIICKPTIWPQVFIGSTGTIPLTASSDGFFGNSFTGSISEAGFNNPEGMALSPDGSLVVADSGNNMIRKIDFSQNKISTIVGDGSNSDVIASSLAKNAKIYHPRGLVYDNTGNLYFSSENGYIRKVDSQGNVTHLGGLPLSNGGILNDQAPSKQMALYQPYGLVFDNDNQILYVADTGNHRVVKFDLATETASTIAGNGTCNPTQVVDNVPALTSSLCSPKYIGLDADKNLIIVDSGHQRIRKVNINFSTTGTLAFSSSAKDGSSLFRYQDGTWSRRYRNGSVAYFNTDGKQISMSDRVGRQIIYQYNSDKNLSRIIDPTGQVSNLSYSGNNLSSITDPAGRTTSFSYSGGQLVAVNFPDSSSKVFEYNSEGLMIREVNQRGFAKKYYYNQYNRLETVTDELNHVTQVNDVLSASMSNNYTGGNVGQFKSQGDGALQFHDRLIDPKNIETEITKDFNGQIIKVKDGKGQLTVIERDIEGIEKAVTFSDGSKVSLEYDPVTRDLLRVKDTGTGIETSQTYDVFGNIIAKMDGNGNTGFKNYDPTTGLLISEIAPGGQKVQYSYNSFGLPISRSLFPTSSSVITSGFEYDNRGNRTKSIEPDGKTTLYSYDNAGNVLQKTRQISSTAQEITKYEYDSSNRLIKVISPKNEITEYSYFPSGELATIKDSYNNVTSFEYDGKGQLLKKTEPDNMVYSFTYDNNGNLATETDPNGNTKVYTTDELNRITRVQLADGELNYTYNAKGEVLNVTNSLSSITQAIDTKGRLISTITAGIGSLNSYPQVSINYGYDFNDNRTSMQSNALSLNYFYDSSNRLRQITSSNGDVYNFDFDSANRVTGIQRPGSSTAFPYNSASLLAGIFHSNSVGVIRSNQFSYDLRNLPTQKRTIAGDFNYSYDPNGQLTAATSPNIVAENFSYDAVGNRTASNDGTYEYTSSRRRIEQDANYTYTHDNNGNMIGKFPKAVGQDKFQYLYTSLNQLKEVRVFDSNNNQKRSVSFAYDPQGRRLSKKLVDFQNSSKSFERFYVYDGPNIIAEYNSLGALLATHTHSPLSDDDILGSEISSEGVSSGLAQSPGKYYYLKDQLGSVDDIVNSTGNIIQHYDYSSFGKIVSIKNAGGADISSSPLIGTSFSFTGREFDQETGLYFYRARTYDPGIGRFLQVDPDPGKIALPVTLINKYTYVGNSPHFYTDPSGQNFFSDIADFGHRFIADFGKNFDGLIKNPGIQFVAVLVAAIVFAPASLPLIMQSIFFSATVSGIISWYNGNRSIDAFFHGAGEFLSDPNNLTRSVALGFVAYNLGLLAEELSIEKGNVKFFEYLGFVGTALKIPSARMSTDEKTAWNIGIIFFAGPYAILK